MKRIILLFAMLHTFFSYAQKKGNQTDFTKIDQQVMSEGKYLYQLDVTATYGLDIFYRELNDLVANTMGYFSYKEANFFKCVFYNKMADAQIIATISFDTTLNYSRAAISTTLRPMSNLEKDLFIMKEHTIDDIKRDTTFYKLYSYTSTTLIPVIYPNSKRVYVITKSDDSTTVFFGNDYQIDFDNANYIASRKAIHNGFVTVDAASKDPYQVEDPKKFMHKHTVESGEYMTPTDVCVLLLYQKKNRWNHHIVMGENVVSVWYCQTNELETVTKKVWEKYNKNKNEDETEEKPVKEKKVASNKKDE